MMPLIWVFIGVLILVIFKRLRDHYQVGARILKKLDDHLEKLSRTTKNGEMLTKDEMTRFLKPLSNKNYRAHCPDCETELLEGPHGGLSVNFACPHKECGSRFNFMGPFGVERISDAQPFKPTPRAEQKQEGPYR